MTDRTLYYFGGPEDGKPILHPLDGQPLDEREILPPHVIQNEAWGTGAYVWNTVTERYEWRELK